MFFRQCHLKTGVTVITLIPYNKDRDNMNKIMSLRPPLCTLFRLNCAKQAQGTMRKN